MEEPIEGSGRRDGEAVTPHLMKEDQLSYKILDEYPKKGRSNNHQRCSDLTVFLQL